MEKQQSYEVVTAAVPRLPHHKFMRWIPEIDKEFSDLSKILSVMVMTAANTVEMKMNLVNWAEYFHRSFKFIDNVGYFRYGLWDSTDVPEEIWDSETRPERDEKAKLADIWVPFGKFESEPKFKDKAVAELEVFRMKRMKHAEMSWTSEPEKDLLDLPALNVLAENIRNRKPGDWDIPVWEFGDPLLMTDVNNLFVFDEKAGLWSVAEPEPMEGKA